VKIKFYCAELLLDRTDGKAFEWPALIKTGRSHAAVLCQIQLKAA
jgi:hypothetical protein